MQLRRVFSYSAIFIFCNFVSQIFHHPGVSAPEFARKFGMSTEEAVVFLEWIKVGVKFKEETLVNAKKSGLGG